MFLDVWRQTALGGDRFTLVRAGLATLVAYGLLGAAVLATAIHLILSALHVPFHLLPLAEPSLVSQGPAPSMLMATSVAALVATLFGLGVSSLYRMRVARDQGPLSSGADMVKPDALVEAISGSEAYRFLVLFQVKHFAFIASRYGDNAANGATRRVMEDLSRTFCAPHAIRRCAGGEFLVMATSQRHDDCILLVEEVRRSVAARTIATAGKELAVALSATVAEIVPNMPASLALEAARRAADHGRDTACEHTVLAFEGHAKVWNC